MNNERTDTTKISVDVAINKAMQYVNILKENGVFNVFAALFDIDYKILTFLSSNPDTHPSILSDQLDVTRPTVAATLKILESKGYITREIDDENRRQIYVNITGKGIKYLQLVDQQCRTLFQGWFNILGEDEIVHLFKILEKSTQISNFGPKLKEATIKKI